MRAAAAITLAVILMAGCSTVEEQQSQVIEEAVILLEKHPHPELPKWDAKRVTFLERAEAYRPKVDPSPAPSPEAK